MNTKRKGNIGESRVLYEFVKLGIPVYLPFGNTEKADLVIEIDGRLLKIQVKTSSIIRKEVLIFNSCSTMSKDGSSVLYTEDDIDYFALYHTETDKVYLLEASEGTNTTISLRLTEPKNGQKKNIRLAKDFILNRHIA